MSKFDKIVKAANRGMVDKSSLSLALRNQKDKLRNQQKVHGALYRATELGTNALVAAASKHYPTLGPLPIAPDVAVAGVAGVMALLGKGKKARAADAIFMGAAHGIIGRLIHTDVFVQARPASEPVSGDDGMSRVINAAGKAVEQGVRNAMAPQVDDEDDEDEDEDEDVRSRKVA